MSEATRPQGKRYSFTYSDPKEPVYESRKLQFRAGSYFKDNYNEAAPAIKAHLESELGLAIPPGYSHTSIRDFLANCQTTEFLEAVTIIAQGLRLIAVSKPYISSRDAAKAWVTFLQRAFAEENSKFEVDNLGGIHPRIDSAFTIQRVDALKGLAGSRYSAAREHFETAHAALDELPPSANRAIREIFMANEEVFKILCPGATKLEGSDLTRRLAPLIDGMSDGAENAGLKGMMRGAVHYIAASHSFRHAQGQPDIAPASLETAVYMVASGTALLRWLLWMDAKVKPVASD